MTAHSDIPALVVDLREKAGKATPGHWNYRPLPHDDWGWVRASEGADGFAWTVAMARSGKEDDQREEYSAHRDAGTDPFEANAAHIAASCPANIIKLCDAYDALVARAEAAERERNEFAAYAHQATRAITNFVDGGSELFAGRIAAGTDREMFKADLEFCSRRSRETLTRARDRANAQHARADAAEARVRELEEALRPFANFALAVKPSADTEIGERIVGAVRQSIRGAWLRHAAELVGPKDADLGEEVPF